MTTLDILYTIQRDLNRAPHYSDRVIEYARELSDRMSDEKREEVARMIFSALREDPHGYGEARASLFDAGMQLLPWHAPQSCLTCTHIFRVYSGSSCPRCGSQDCGTLEALVPREPLKRRTLSASARNEAFAEVCAALDEREGVQDEQDFQLLLDAIQNEIESRR
jgi:hypothetical protein